jgi:hypothetical protein
MALSKFRLARSFSQLVMPTMPNNAKKPRASKPIVNRMTKRTLIGMAQGWQTLADEGDRRAAHAIALCISELGHGAAATVPADR